MRKNQPRCGGRNIFRRNQKSGCGEKRLPGRPRFNLLEQVLEAVHVGGALDGDAAMRRGRARRRGEISRGQRREDGDEERRKVGPDDRLPAWTRSIDARVTVVCADTTVVYI
jgi:hypothetical protein